MHKFLNMQQPAEADALDTTEKFLTSWLHKLQIGVAMKLGLMLVSCIAVLLVGASFLLSSYLATQLQDNALEVLRSNTRIFHNNITTEYKRVLRDAERYSNVYINNYQNMSPAPLRSLDENALKALLNDTNINAHFTELTSVFASTLVREGDQFVRVSSTLQGKEGKIATSTVLSHDNPAYAALLKNKPFSGVVVIYG